MGVQLCLQVVLVLLPCALAVTQKRASQNCGDSSTEEGNGDLYKSRYFLIMWQEYVCCRVMLWQHTVAPSMRNKYLLC